MKVYFSHGKESGPWGSKIRHLAAIAQELAFSVESLDYSDIQNPDLRVARLLEALKAEEGNVILVGSSMGGYVSTVASMTHAARGLFLLAPALYMPGYDHQIYPTKCRPLTVIHGWQDDIIPAANSIRFCEEQRAELHLIDGDHRLNDRLPTLGALFKSFLQEIMA